MEKLKLYKPVELDGKKVNEIQYDFDALTGSCIEDAMKSVQKAGYAVAVQETDTVLHAHIFAQAAGIDYTDMKRLHGKDYMKAAGAVRDFFLADSEESQQKDTSEQ